MMTSKKTEFMRMATLLVGGAVFAFQQDIGAGEALDHAEKFIKEADTRGLIPSEEEL